MRTLGVIPARGGSKGIPRKNIRLMGGEPLIAYAIQAAKESRLLTAFVTSTEDEEIAEVARINGSPVINRPPELAQDDSPIVDVLLHAVKHAEKDAGKQYDAVLILQPTAPLRIGRDIDSVIEMLDVDCTADTIISVCPVEDSHPARMYCIDDAGYMRPLWPEWETLHRQRLPVVYHRNGAMYLVRRSVLVEKKTVMGERRRAYIMPHKQLLNIDDERDLMLADVMINRWKRGSL